MYGNDEKEGEEGRSAAKKRLTGTGQATSGHQFTRSVFKMWINQSPSLFRLLNGEIGCPTPFCCKLKRTSLLPLPISEKRNGEGAEVGNSPPTFMVNGRF